MRIHKSIKPASEKSVEYWHLAKQQLEAAAATSLGSFSKYAIIQNSCLSIELLLKGTLRAEGVAEKTLKNDYRHNIKKMATETTRRLPNIDRETFLFAIEQLPDYVRSRYEAMNFSRIELGTFLMNAQFVSGEVLRQYSGRNTRESFLYTDSEVLDIANRTFPKPAS